MFQIKSFSGMFSYDVSYQPRSIRSLPIPLHGHFTLRHCRQRKPARLSGWEPPFSPRAAMRLMPQWRRTPALGVVAPMMNGIGGDLFVIVYEAKTGRLYGLNASGWSPAGLTAEYLLRQGLTEMPRMKSTPSRSPVRWMAGTSFCGALAARNCPMCSLRQFAWQKKAFRSAS